MEGNVQNVVGYLKKGTKFVIPVYQRNYDWTLENCQRLMEDLVELNSSGKNTHFFGSIVIKPNAHAEEIIIDGQQRITTLSLLFLAIVKWLDNNEVNTILESDRLKGDFLLDYYKPTNDQIRLHSNPRDYEAYTKLYGDKKFFVEASNITRNYKYIYSFIDNMEITIDELFQSLTKLQFMIISLNSPDDDPQLIFESLNSTGLELTNADKIRNYLLMNEELDMQDHLYLNYWKPIEERTSFNLSEFFRMYLTTKNAQTPTIKYIYDEFKKYYENNWEDKEAFFIDLEEYSFAYQQILGHPVGDKKIDSILFRLNQIEVTVTHPFLMAVLRDLNNEELSTENVGSIFEVVESYIARRMIAQIPSNALNKIFAVLYRDYRKHSESTHASNFEPIDIISYLLLTKEKTGLFPTNEDIRSILQTRDMYNINSKFRTYFFECLENYNHVENLKIYEGIDEQDYSIEHIMPQNLSAQWEIDLGEESEHIHEMYVHNLGNLTLTGYNPKMSNRSFFEKQNMDRGFRESHFVNLNAIPASVESWGEEEIIQRRDSLIEQSLKIWEYPETEYTPKKDVEDLYEFDGINTFTNYTAKGYTFRNEDYHTVESWIDFYIQLVTIITKENPSAIGRIAESENRTGLDSVFLTKQERKTAEIIPGIYAKTHLSNRDKISIIKQLFDILEIDYNQLQIDAVPPKEIDN
ncbi:hypothetical protein HMPREF2811_08095 [Globicatella sp. HMSC072A10]|uniref:DUF262 domain-containing protein n=1 Tax=Globicatella sp. HMSC072A10 TaxID=1739315 RepID=UPI0008B7A1AD|nr:DUF262 domain-containing protein [Globicatella sp. HMSC072A10]OFK54605.1 hypothetical protein HMPREF2811_08095 [Globicatella sp. HMSC072A10]